jgi:hypothetical protein
MTRELPLTPTSSRLIGAVKGSGSAPPELEPLLELEPLELDPPELLELELELLEPEPELELELLELLELELLDDDEDSPPPPPPPPHPTRGNMKAKSIAYFITHPFILYLFYQRKSPTVGQGSSKNEADYYSLSVFFLKSLTQ